MAAMERSQAALAAVQGRGIVMKEEHQEPEQRPGRQVAGGWPPSGGRSVDLGVFKM